MKTHDDSEHQRMILEWSLKKNTGDTSQEREKYDNLKKHLDTTLETVGAHAYAIAIDLPTYDEILSIPAQSSSIQDVIDKLMRVQYQIMRLWKIPDMEKLRPDLRALKATVAQMIQTHNFISLHQPVVPESTAPAQVVSPLPDIVPDRMYTLAEAAKALGKSKDTMYGYNAEKPEPRIPFTKDGGKSVRYRGQDLLAYRDGGKNMKRAIEVIRAKRPKPAKQTGNGASSILENPVATKFKRPRLNEILKREQERRRS